MIELKSVFMPSILDESLGNVKTDVNKLDIMDCDMNNDELRIMHGKAMREIYT
ncbi:hypothetical protein THOM_1808 [Trachipleistophora hominis]|uniref:Uncharacterized protein n=1 Tax=Trachipleistophora hominis TaxID=72359 RepID=L7JW40_TRAHO|nr:hypothetical protein THOM_1808 [Trachipleistophora hominis]